MSFIFFEYHLITFKFKINNIYSVYNSTLYKFEEHDDL